MYRLGCGGKGGKCHTLDGLCRKPMGSTVDTTCVGCCASVLFSTWDDSSRFLNLLRTKRIEIIVSFLIPTILYTTNVFWRIFFVNYSVTIIQFQERVTRLSAWLSQFSFRNFWTFSITKMFQFLLFFSVLSATWIHAAFVHFLTVFFWFFRFLLIFPKILVLSLFQKRLSNLWHNLKNDRKNRIAVLFYSTSWIVLSKLRSRMCLNTARSQVYFSLSFPRSVRRVVCYNDNIFSRRTLIKL